MDEVTAVMKARDLLRRVNSNSIPTQLELYLQALECQMKVDDGLPPDEPGYSFTHGGKHFIVVNGKDSPERQRFTILHEIAHIVLGVPSEHAGSPAWSYARRSENEMHCDAFAAELLLPHGLFKPLVDKATIGFDALDGLADKFEASTMTTGSRFAAAADIPCAFVISENGKIRYASRSKALREAGAWIPPRIPIPASSLSAMVRSGQVIRDARDVAADVWFSDWTRGGTLLEEARHLTRYDQTLTLLWFDDEEVPRETWTGQEDDEDDGGLRELDGILPFPGKHRRR